MAGEDLRLLTLGCVRSVDVDCARLADFGVGEALRAGADGVTRRLDVDGFLSGVRVELRDGVGGWGIRDIVDYKRSTRGS